ncbi:MAG: TerB family tellurite resistance protein [Nannocystaceae bacterium]|nr:TerB family tellurite resistance protein [Nannocystaceae bacterium]
MSVDDPLSDLTHALSRFRVASTPPDAVLDAMVAFAYSDGLASHAELEYIASLRFAGDSERASAEIARSTERLRQDADFRAALTRVGGMLRDDAERIEVLAFAVAVAYADLEIQRAEDQAIAWLCDALGLGFARAHEVCDAVADAVEANEPLAHLPPDATLPLTFVSGLRWPGFARS